MNQKLLEKLGMSDKEVGVYLKLLEVGTSGANSLALRLNENRTTTYSLLLALQKKGFVSYYLRAGVKIFVPTEPNVLINKYMEDAKGLSTILPQLLALSNTAATKPKITFYEGLSGIKQIAEILLEEPCSVRESFMGLEEETVHPEMKKYLEEDFLPRRIELGILYRGIVAGYVPMTKKYPQTEKGHLRELKYVDPKKFPIKIHVDIFPRNKVAIYSYHRDDMIGVIIEHEHFFTTMKSVFRLAWAGVDVLMK
ncbi:hypothetical protein KBD59_03890 [Candidatus Gracilibacteria bacterium]|nr:hypothetical protein [Candidatus Gracilibacteria bacterium]